MNGVDDKLLRGLLGDLAGPLPLLADVSGDESDDGDDEDHMAGRIDSQLKYLYQTGNLGAVLQSTAANAAQAGGRA